jgi:hypothetical protein
VRDTMNAASLRRLAMECAAKASRQDCSADERDRLEKMREALLALALDADWLDGKCSPVASADPEDRQSA